MNTQQKIASARSQQGLKPKTRDDLAMENLSRIDKVRRSMLKKRYRANPKMLSKLKGALKKATTQYGRLTKGTGRYSVPKSNSWKAQFSRLNANGIELMGAIGYMAEQMSNAQQIASGGQPDGIRLNSSLLERIRSRLEKLGVFIPEVGNPSQFLRDLLTAVATRTGGGSDSSSAPQEEILESVTMSAMQRPYDHEATVSYIRQVSDRLEARCRDAEEATRSADPSLQMSAEPMPRKRTRRDQFSNEILRELTKSKRERYAAKIEELVENGQMPAEKGHELMSALGSCQMSAEREDRMLWRRIRDTIACYGDVPEGAFWSGAQSEQFSDVVPTYTGDEESDSTNIRRAQKQLLRLMGSVAK
jgi:hypothetical protein